MTPQPQHHPFDTMTEPELQRFMRELADIVVSKLPPNTGFVLLCAPVGDSGVAQYVSNVERGSASKWMLETVERWRKGDYIPR